MVVDSHQRTDVPGLYAAGDVDLGLDQISHAMGEGSVAATAIRNDLDALRPCAVRTAVNGEICPHALISCKRVPSARPEQGVH